MPTKNLSETFTLEEFERLEAAKGDRTWREAILEEFGVTEDTNE